MSTWQDREAFDFISWVVGHFLNGNPVNPAPDTCWTGAWHQNYPLAEPSTAKRLPSLATWHSWARTTSGKSDRAFYPYTSEAWIPMKLSPYPDATDKHVEHVAVLLGTVPRAGYAVLLFPTFPLP